MPAMAHCPQCEHEFYPDADSAHGAEIHCPECGAMIELPAAADFSEELELAGESVPAGAVENGESGSVDSPSRRIEKWFHGADTVTDIPVREIGYPIEADFQSRPTEPTRPRLAPQQTADNSATVEFDSMTTSEQLQSADDEELQLEPPEPLPTPSATWEDSERIEKILADIENKQNNDYLPVERTDRMSPGDHSPDDVSPDDVPTLEDTSQYETVEAEPPADTYDRSWSPEGVDPRMVKSLLVGAPPLRKRKSSLVRMLVMTVIGGVMGLAIADYALMWWYGPTGDMLKIADYLPKQMLPPSFAKASQPETGDGAKSAPGAPAGEMAATTAQDDINKSAAAGESKTGEIQTSFEASLTPPAGGNRPSGVDRYAKSPTNNAPAGMFPGEPARIDEQPAMTLGASIMPAIRIEGARSYMVDQYNTALSVAREAQAGMVYGNLDEPELRRAKGVSYNRLCDLAEIATFVDGSHDTPSAMESLRQATEQIYRDTLAEPRVRLEVARIAPVWIGSANRRHGGIFFAATLSRQSQRGAITECEANLPDGTTLTVLLPPELAKSQFGRSTAVVGSLIDRPAERVPGYSGAARQAVWASSLIPLAD